MILVLAKLTPKDGKDDEIINAALTLVGKLEKRMQILNITLIKTSRMILIFLSKNGKIWMV